MAQTNYSIYTPVASYPGQPADSGFTDKISCAAVAAALPYGCLIVTDTTNSGDFGHIAGKVPAQASDITAVGSALGVSIADQTRTQNPSLTSGAFFEQFSAVACMRVGRIWVNVEGAVNSGSPVFVRFASGAGGTQAGSLRADADTATAAQLPNAVFRSTTTGAGFAVVELNLA